jgi:hypothetical protein
VELTDGVSRNIKKIVVRKWEYFVFIK